MGRKSRKKAFQKSVHIVSPQSTVSGSKSALHLLNRKSLLIYFLISVVTCIAYGNTLNNGFIHDDQAEILNNLFIRDFSHLTDIFTNPAWSFSSTEERHISSNYYRPMQYLIYMGLYHFFGASPKGYHLFKLLLHLGNCLLIFLIISRHFKNYPLAFSTSLLFCVHPANTEAVAWISGIPDTTCAFFFLLSFLFYLRFSENPSLIDKGGIFLSFLVGMFSKETMVTFIPLLFAYEWLSNKKVPSKSRIFGLYVPLVFIFSIYLAMRILSIGGLTDPRQLRYAFLNPIQSVLNQAVLLSDYIKMCFMPLHLNAHHHFDPVLSVMDSRVAIAFFILASIVLFVLLIQKVEVLETQRLFLLGIFWFLFTLSPVIVFFKRVGNNVFAERYLYLPILGLILSLSVSVLRLRRRFPLRVDGVLALILFLCAWKVIKRNEVWANQTIFYETTARDSPKSTIILNNLGTVYAGALRYQDAIRVLEASVTLEPDYTAYRNLGQVYAAVGKPDDSIRAYEKAVTLGPNDSGSYEGMGDVYFAQQHFNEAIRQYKNSLSLSPQNPKVILNLAEAYAQTQNYQEAIMTYESLTQFGSQYASRAYRGLIAVYSNLKDSTKVSYYAQKLASSSN